MARTDDNLPGLGQRTLVPRLASGAASLAKNLSQSEGYVLSRIDGRTTLWEICLLVPMRRDDTLRALRRLRADGVIEVPGSLEPMPPSERSAPAPAARSPLTSARSHAPASSPVSTPPAAATPELLMLLDDPVEAEAPRGPAPPAQPAPAAVPPQSSAPPPEPGRTPARPQPTRPTASTPTPVPSLRSFVSSQSVFAAQPAVDSAGRSRDSAPRVSLADRRPGSRQDASPYGRDEGRDASPGGRKEGSKKSPDLSDMAQFQPAAPVPEVEVIQRSSRASGLIDDTRPSRRTEPPRQPASRTSVPSAPPQGRAAPGAQSVRPEPARPTAPPADGYELSHEQRRRIDEVHAQLSIADAFTLLGVSPQDDRKAVQRAYFKLSKEFHPDRFFKKQLGPYQGRIASVFQAITEARDILIDADRRARYLAGDPQG